MQLHDYQKRAVEYIHRKKHPFLMADVGVGKTAMALTAVAQLPNPTLVLAPLRVCYNTWPDEIRKWTPSASYVILHGSKKDTRLRLKRDLYVMNYESLKWYLKAITHGYRLPQKLNLILDESSFVKSPSTVRFKTLQKLMPIFTDYRICMSATPSSNGLHELWSQYYMLDQGKRLEKTFYSFRNKYFHYTGPPIFKTIPFPDTGQKIFNKVKDVTFRLDAKDYLKMPPITYNAINLNLTPRLQKMYNTLEKDFFVELGNGQEVEIFNAAALSNKLRQFIQGCVYTDKVGNYEKIHNIKIEALKELRESTSQPILCPVQFRFELAQIQKQIRGVPFIAGGTKAHEASVYITEWNKGNIPLLLCHPASLGHGVNLQAGGHILLWMGITWSLEQYLQMNGRLYRQGQQQGVIINHLVMKNTTDELIVKALSTKHITQRGLLNALRDEARRKHHG